MNTRSLLVEKKVQDIVFGRRLSLAKISGGQSDVEVRGIIFSKRKMRSTLMVSDEKVREHSGRGVSARAGRANDDKARGDMQRKINCLPKAD